MLPNWETLHHCRTQRHVDNMEQLVDIMGYLVIAGQHKSSLYGFISGEGDEVVGEVSGIIFLAEVMKR